MLVIGPYSLPEGDSLFYDFTKILPIRTDP